MTVLLALALAVAVSVIQTERMVKSSTIRAADQFDILVGTKGSRSALLLGTVYLRDEMLSLVPMPVLNDLSPKSSDISWAAPLAFGDRGGKASLVGTTRVFVDRRKKNSSCRPAILKSLMKPSRASMPAFPSMMNFIPAMA